MPELTMGQIFNPYIKRDELAIDVDFRQVAGVVHPDLLLPFTVPAQFQRYTLCSKRLAERLGVDLTQQHYVTREFLVYDSKSTGMRYTSMKVRRALLSGVVLRSVISRKEFTNPIDQFEIFVSDQLTGWSLFLGLSFLRRNFALDAPGGIYKLVVKKHKLAELCPTQRGTGHAVAP